jgi:hypothetical protein
VKFVAMESSCGKGMAAEFKSFSSPHTNTGPLLNQCFKNYILKSKLKV